MKIIKKYVLKTPTAHFEIPQDSKVMFAEGMGDKIWLWIEVDDIEPMTTIIVHTLDTDCQVPYYANYLNTVRMENNQFMHVYTYIYSPK